MKIDDEEKINFDDILFDFFFLKIKIDEKENEKLFNCKELYKYRLFIIVLWIVFGLVILLFIIRVFYLILLLNY